LFNKEKKKSFGGLTRKPTNMGKNVFGEGKPKSYPGRKNRYIRKKAVLWTIGGNPFDLGGKTL